MYSVCAFDVEVYMLGYVCVATLCMCEHDQVSVSLLMHAHVAVHVQMLWMALVLPRLEVYYH